MSGIRLAPSILAADLADLGAAVELCERGGADVVHVDVMDGRFVPNLTFGAPVAAAIARRTDLPLDIHMMVEDPDRLLDDYLACEPAWVSVHWEAARHLDRTLAAIRSAGARAGVALNPATPVDALRDVLGELDFVLLMSVNPGFAGQPFLPYVLDKCRRLSDEIARRGLEVTIEMDGGLGVGTIERAAAAGARLLVAGSAIFGTADPVRAMRELRELAEEEA